MRHPVNKQDPQDQVRSLICDEADQVSNSSSVQIPLMLEWETNTSKANALRYFFKEKHAISTAWEDLLCLFNFPLKSLIWERQSRGECETFVLIGFGYSKPIFLSNLDGTFIHYWGRLPLPALCQKQYISTKSFYFDMPIIFETNKQTLISQQTLNFTL